MFNLFRSRRVADSCILTDVGLVRADNQDAVFANRAGTVFLVADGMGGVRGGARASAVIREEIAAISETDGFLSLVEAVDAAILRANARILAEARENGYVGMGSTVAVVVLDADPNGPRLAMGHIGDSRVYRRRNRILERMTEDHRAGAYSNLLTRAVGTFPDVEVDWCWAGVEKGDVWLVCSDGVHDMLPDTTINGILAHGGTAAEAVSRLSDAVRRAGARDNYTLALFMV